MSLKNVMQRLGFGSPPAEIEAFEPENELEALLVSAASNAQSRPRFIQILLNSDLLVATPQSPPTRAVRTISAGEKIQILNVQAPDGSAIPAIVTSELRLAQTFGAGTGYVGMNGKQLFEIVAESDAWINPGAQYGVLYSSEELANVLGWPRRRVVQEETQILLGSPADSPDELIRHLQDVLATDTRVVAAHLALAKWPDSDETTWYLEIGSDADADSVGSTIGVALQGAPLDGKPLDVLVRNPLELSGTGVRIIPATSHS